ncbi:hypothetical protein BpHYR1_012079 [Brachionus plicatilis]|uniref:RNA-directed DNA polymerase from mobile element jockey-like n=1 Tax=Brachionus plicatilis TaxID=10195 RepID=A0A3M7SS24_BRAPC|nr:hypothetical protein BpHYR1_012079 [Brachionus plicatilis]
MFKTTVGVKQGGPLSQKLFSIYVEELIEEIMNTNLISEIDGIKTGVLILCEDYGLRTEIKFNPSKTQIMRINGSKKDEVKLELSGSVGHILSRVDSSRLD